MQDLSSPANMEPVSPAVEALSLKSLDHQGSPNMLLFKKKKIHIYLTAPGLSYGLWDLVP